MSAAQSISRRRFLKRLGAVAAVAAVGRTFAPRLWAADALPAHRDSRVVVVSNPKAIARYETNSQEVARMLERGMLALTGKDSVTAAWRHFVTPEDVVGLKIATEGGASFSTHSALIDAVVDGLRGAGVKPENIIVWDKSAEAMRRAGLPVEDEKKSAPPSPTHPRYLGTMPHAGYDEEIFYESAMAGRLLWGDSEFGRADLGTRSYFSRIVTRRATKLICLPVMSDGEAGVSGCLYTMATGATDNTRRFASSNFDPAAAEICAQPVLRDKWCLNIADGLVAQYFGGPSFHPRYCWDHASLYLSADPVATDTLMLEQLEAMRKRASVTAIGDRAQHIQSAAAYELGEASLARIEKILL